MQVGVRVTIDFKTHILRGRITGRYYYIGRPVALVLWDNGTETIESAGTITLERKL